MKPSEFQYHAPTTVDEAAQLIGTLDVNTQHPARLGQHFKQ